MEVVRVEAGHNERWCAPHVPLKSSLLALCRTIDVVALYLSDVSALVRESFARLNKRGDVYVRSPVLCGLFGK